MDFKALAQKTTSKINNAPARLLIGAGAVLGLLAADVLLVLAKKPVEDVTIIEGDVIIDATDDSNPID